MRKMQSDCEVRAKGHIRETERAPFYLYSRGIKWQSALLKYMNTFETYKKKIASDSGFTAFKAITQSYFIEPMQSMDWHRLTENIPF